MMCCRGERIAYELSLQELQVVYNGFGGALSVKIITFSAVHPDSKRKLVQILACKRGMLPANAASSS